VSKEFTSFFPRRRVRALKDLDLNLGPGDIVGLVGPNGSGKTTTFRLAAGLVGADRGSVSLFGAAPDSLAARSRLGYMPEQPGFPGTHTPCELLHFVGRIFGMDRRVRENRIGELSDLVSLHGFLKRRMSGLSKGMVKRTGLATALINEPELLLLDEPLEGVDPLGSIAIKKHLRDLAGKGAAVLISSHILSDVEELCDFLVILNEGSVILSGPKNEILEGQPRESLENLFRRLLGSPGSSVDRSGGGRGSAT